MNKRLLDNFIRYAKIDTQSDEDSETVPSTEKQFNLAKVLEADLNALGLQDVCLDGNCYLTATLLSNSTEKYPIIGLLAHMDTSPDMSGENVRPRIVHNYDGNDIILDSENKIVLSPSVFPELKSYIGKTIITADGKTLLGADDKAGVAEIIEVLHYLKEHPEFKHGTIRIGFTPDEEVGRGADKFDVGKFGADFAYTIDGGKIGEIEYETFNAASAKIKIKGCNVHPGSAKNKMVNAIHLGHELNNMLPSSERPEYTEKYEGFYHLLKFNGSVEEAVMQYIIRDHDKVKFEKRKKRLERIVAYLNDKYAMERFTLELKDQYYNMKEKIEEVKYIVDLAVKAVEEAGIEPDIIPVRGGTDGSRLSYMGLPCPNIFNGHHNGHGRYEYVPLESMEKSVEVILNILRVSLINFKYLTCK